VSHRISSTCCLLLLLRLLRQLVEVVSWPQWLPLRPRGWCWCCCCW
jgi:hypothetical protein